MSGEGRSPANTLSPPRHALTVIIENANLSLVTKGWVGDKPLARGHRGARHCGEARYRRRMARKTTEGTSHVQDGVWRSPPYLEGSLP
jgi:hypothetical protein